MAKQSIIHFSQPFQKYYSEKGCVLGSVEKTVWCLRYIYNIKNGKDYLELTRLPDNGKVEIDIEVLFKKSYILSNHAEPILDGQKSILFELSEIVCGDMFSFVEGYVTVRYNTNCTLTSKKEEFTQTNNVSTPAEKIYPYRQLTNKKELGSQTDKEIAKVVEKTIPSPQLLNDLLHLFDNPDSFSDAVLVCGTLKFPVHRVILSARSPVFATMFKTQMQEGREGFLDIVDMEPDVLKALLRHVYSGRTDHLTHSMAGDMLFAADKYQLEELKSICVDQLKENMAENNVLRSLVLGDLYDKSLKAHAVEFICQYK